MPDLPPDSNNKHLRDILLSRTEALTHKFPENLPFHALRGAALLLEGDYKNAIPDIQQALRNPALRPLMFLFLAECYTERNMHDLSTKQLMTLLEELPDTTRNEG